MTEDKGNIEKLLQENLQGRKVAAPAFVWDNVAKEIGEKKKKRFFFWWWSGPVIGGLLIGGYFLTKNGIFNTEKERCYYAFNDHHQADYLYEKYADKSGDEFADNTNAAVDEVIVGDEIVVDEFVNLPEGQIDLSENQNTVDGLDANQSANLLEQGHDSDNNGIVEIEASTVVSNLAIERNTRDGSVEETIELNVELENKEPITNTLETENRANQDAPANEDETVMQGAKAPNELEQVELNKSENSIIQKDSILDTSPDKIDDTEDLKDLILTELDEAKPQVPDTSNAPLMDSLSQVDSDQQADTVSAVDSVSAKKEEVDKTKKWSLAFHGGYSTYDMTVFNDQFRSGALSNRRFESSGFDLDAAIKYQLSRKFALAAGINYNKKTTFFNYSIRTDDQGYFEHVILENPLPLAEINDADESCNCYLISDVTAAYSIATVFLNLGAEYSIYESRKIAASASLYGGISFNSAFQLNQASILDITDQSTHFSDFNVGLGLNGTYWLNQQLGLSFTPRYQLIFGKKDHPWLQKTVKEFIPSLGIKFKF